MPDYPNEGALRGGHIPGAKSVPWARAINPEDGTFKTGRRAARDLRRARASSTARQDDRRLLPHRRAQQPHLVRADLPARLRERPQLRRQLDRVGQLGRRADREVAPPAMARVSGTTRRTLLDAVRGVDRHRRTAPSCSSSFARPVQGRAARGGDAAVPPEPPGAALRVGGVRVGACRSADGTLKLHFAVENPSGISAKALAAILDQALSGLPPAEVADGRPGDRRDALPPEHLDGQGHGPDVDGADGTSPGQTAAHSSVGPAPNGTALAQVLCQMGPGLDDTDGRAGQHVGPARDPGVLEFGAARRLRAAARHALA